MGALIDHRQDQQYFLDAYAKVTFSREGIDWQALADIYARAPLAVRSPDEIRRAFRNSYLCCFARVDGKLVGAARATSDGVFYATVMDVAVDPGYQRNGVGRKMMEALLARLPFQKIYLTAVPGKEGFYEKFGFAPQDRAMSFVARPPVPAVQPFFAERPFSGSASAEPPAVEPWGVAAE